MYGILNYIAGYVSIEIEGEHALATVNALHADGYRFRALTPTDKGFSLRHSVFGADSFIARLDTMGISYSITGRGGFSFFVGRYIKRAGLFVGLLLALAIVYGSTRLVWDVRVECGGEFDEKEVLHSLKELGLYVGAEAAEVDVYRAEQTFLAENRMYSDIAINMQGTVAMVQLRLSSGGEHADSDSAPSDIVASEAGVVRKITATKGEPAVAAGDTVAKGDLLISGAVTGKYGAVYLHPAKGSVVATVFRDFTVVIPLEGTKKQPTGRSETKTAYTVLGKEIALFSAEETSFPVADLTVQSEKLMAFGMALPIVKETLTYSEYKEIPVTLTEQEARERALAAFHGYLERETVGRVVETETDFYFNEELNSLILTATATLETEIGINVPITPQGAAKESALTEVKKGAVKNHSSLQPHNIYICRSDR